MSKSKHKRISKFTHKSLANFTSDQLDDYLAKRKLDILGNIRQEFYNGFSTVTTPDKQVLTPELIEQAKQRLLDPAYNIEPKWILPPGYEDFK